MRRRKKKKREEEEDDYMMKNILINIRITDDHAAAVALDVDVERSLRVMLVGRDCEPNIITSRCLEGA